MRKRTPGITQLCSLSAQAASSSTAHKLSLQRHGSSGCSHYKPAFAHSIDSFPEQSLAVSIKNTCGTQINQLGRRSRCNTAKLSTKEGRGAQVSLGHTGLRRDVRLARQVTHHWHRHNALAARASIAATGHEQV